MTVGQPSPPFRSHIAGPLNVQKQATAALRYRCSRAPAYKTEHVGCYPSALVLSQPVTLAVVATTIFMSSTCSLQTYLYLTGSLLRTLILSVVVQWAAVRLVGVSVVGGIQEMLVERPAWLCSVFLFGGTQALYVQMVARQLGPVLASALGIEYLA